MFKVNDTVVHYRDGVAKIVGKTLMSDNEYFVLNVKRIGDISVYVPLNKAENVIRHVLNIEQVDELIKYAKEIPENFVSNTKQRRDEFKRRLASSDVHDLIYLCKLLYLFKTLPQLPEGVKFGPMDVEMLYDAHNRLFDEFAVIFNIERELIERHIIERSKSL